MAIQLWAVRFERPLSAEERRRALALLPPQRRERTPEVPDAALWAYLLLRLALKEAYGWESLPEMTCGVRGKPAFRDCPEVHFNLSHTRGGALVGLGGRPLGVDMEKIRPMKPETMEKLTGTTEPAEFFRHWVRREARSKRTGAGLAAAMRTEPPMEPGEVCRDLVTFPGYAAGVSACGEEISGAVRLLEAGKLLRLTFSEETV